MYLRWLLDWLQEAPVERGLLCLFFAMPIIIIVIVDFRNKRK